MSDIFPGRFQGEMPGARERSRGWRGWLYSEAGRDEYTTTPSGPSLKNCSPSTDRPSRALRESASHHAREAASICERSDYAALRIGGSFAGLHMRIVAALQHASPQIRNISAVAIALKLVRRPSMKNSAPMLKNQLFQSHAENMTAPPE